MKCSSITRYSFREGEGKRMRDETLGGDTESSSVGDTKNRNLNNRGGETRTGWFATAGKG